MVIIVKKLISSCDTNEQGDVLYAEIRRVLDRGEGATVDFSGILYATSSFVNSALVPLLDAMTLDAVKSRVRFRGTLPAVADMIRSRLTFEASRSHAA
ncbi:STAS-like domain-containing protein [Paracoccus sp. SSJ]|uniref:STAS-like domain-containing protein n=1 Tax=Paracoccus sp. SSJ TaxID=3050636 RepID=UPI00255144D3|nr:STAS-like domain-containing protein [Paracoccus sp. SSJ]MDK8874378.1 STAS-like domain-containing protein [Paracoccus sp. SSJ]